MMLTAHDLRQRLLDRNQIAVGGNARQLIINGETIAVPKPDWHRWNASSAYVHWTFVEEWQRNGFNDRAFVHNVHIDVEHLAVEMLRHRYRHLSEHEMALAASAIAHQVAPIYNPLF